MLFGTKPILEEIIVEELGTKRSLTVSALRRIIDRKHRPCSKQAVYKAISRLQDEGIIVKVGQELSLKSSFIINILRFADKLAERQTVGLSKAELIAGAKAKLKWQFTDIKKMDDFWAHTLISLLQDNKHPVAFEWVPRPWFELVHREKEKQFQQILKNKNKRIYLMVGGRGYLDKYCSQFWPGEIYTYSLSEGPFESIRNTYFDVVGDYILTFRFDKYTTERIESFFESVNKSSDLSVRGYNRIFAHSMKITAGLELNAKKANKLRTQFVNFFGIPSPRI